MLPYGSNTISQGMPPSLLLFRSPTFSTQAHHTTPHQTNLLTFRARWSMSRPGVAITMSAPPRIAKTWGQCERAGAWAGMLQVWAGVETHRMYLGEQSAWLHIAACPCNYA